jgi:hypothetical protein
MKPAYLAVGIVLIIVGGFVLLFAHEIWRLYYDGPETCTLPNYPVDSVPTCASVDTEITTLAIAGIVFLVVAGIVIFLGRKKN